MPLTDVNRADPPDYLVIFAWSFLRDPDQER
jgi:hypothetical protein